MGIAKPTLIIIIIIVSINIIIIEGSGFIEEMSW
jgi:hypothetical protein